MKQSHIKFISGFVLSGLFLFTSCHSTREAGQANYEIIKIEGTRVCMDSTWDANPDVQAETILKPYKEKVDKMMY